MQNIDTPPYLTTGADFRGGIDGSFRTNNEACALEKAWSCESNLSEERKTIFTSLAMQATSYYVLPDSEQRMCLMLSTVFRQSLMTDSVGTQL